MKRYQAGVGPGMGNCHLYEVNDDPKILARPSLCGSTNVVRDYKADIDLNNQRLCKRCFSDLQKRLGGDACITAEIIGVSEII